METRHQLRAWMRYDSLGRAVAGSLIYSKDRPKMGNWREVATRQSGNITTTSTTTATPGPILSLTFIEYADMVWLVGDPYNLSDWNIFFDLPIHGNPFTSIRITDNKIDLIGGSNITLLDNMFGYVQLTDIYDPEGCIVDSEPAPFPETELVNVYLPALIIVPNAAFYHCRSLTSVYIPSATTCESYAFEYCLSLVNLSLPNIVSIGDDVFYRCDSLTTLDLPKLVTTDIGMCSGLNQLTSINMPSLTSVANFCFYDCNLITVDLPLVTTIGDDSFEANTMLESVNIPNLTTAGEWCFYGCESLTTISFPLLQTIEESSFSNCYSLTSINFPEVHTIAGFAFQHSNLINTFNFPKVTYIKDWGFYDALGMTSLSIPICTNLGSDVYDDGVFGHIIGKIITLTIPAALMTCNAGQPDGDILDLQDTNTVTIITV